MKSIRTLFAFAASALLFTAQLASAHAHPHEQSPAPNATVAAPQEVRIAYTEELEQSLSSLKVLDGSGKVLADKATLDAADHKVIHLPLPALSAGVYTVEWVAVAEDGHRTNGKYTFTVK
ncbi:MULTISPECIES: copper homeostasis periplasmic binding protein CopC [Silvimonas]|uniref:copper homeostasis periplasmic binding protein CopC n=1 Tax=Silvimonas TaxID=300264 RepID=UPI0024B3513E|nr:MULTISPECIES: copper homeostasis periplasmic binding protein CopC [Silvimonas]MDR3428315.1 copper homeostasis periplasmic binding protein CopC [Silvimonas sp.]